MSFRVNRRPLLGCYGGPFEVHHNADHKEVLLCSNYNCYRIVGCDRCIARLRRTEKSLTDQCFVCKNRKRREWETEMRLVTVESVSIAIFVSLIVLWCGVYIYKNKV